MGQQANIYVYFLVYLWPYLKNICNFDRHSLQLYIGSGTLQTNTTYTVNIIGLRNRESTEAFINGVATTVDYLVNINTELFLSQLQGNTYIGGFPQSAQIKVSFCSNGTYSTWNWVPFWVELFWTIIKFSPRSRIDIAIDPTQWLFCDNFEVPSFQLLQMFVSVFQLGTDRLAAGLIACVTSIQVQGTEVRFTNADQYVNTVLQYV